MAKNLDLNLELDEPTSQSSSGLDLGLDLDKGAGLQQFFPARQAVQRATFNIRKQPQQTVPQKVESDLSRGVTISQGEPTKISPIRKAIRAIPGESRFERSLETDVLDPLASVGRFFFPDEQDYYREATEDLGEKATTEEVLKRGRELMEKDGFVKLSPEIGGPTLSPADSLPTAGTIGAASKLGVGVKRGIRRLGKLFAKQTDEKVIEDTLRRIVPEVDDVTARTFSRLTSRTDDPKVISDLVEETSRRTEARLAEQAPRRFNANNLPDVGPDESLVVFKRTGGDNQYIFNNIEDAQKFFQGRVDDLEIGVAPRKALQRVTDDAAGNRQNVFTIPRNIADDVVELNRALRRGVLDEVELQRFIDNEVLPSRPSTPEAVLGRTPSPLITTKRREATILRDKLRQAQSISRRAAVATRKEVKEIQNDLVDLVGDLPLEERGKFIRTIKNIQTPSQLQKKLPNIQERVTEALEKVAASQQKKALRSQVRQLISQKQLSNTESLRKALSLPSLNQMTVDDLRSFARNLAEFQPGDRFLSQRVLETIDRTPLSGMKTYREVQKKLAEEAGVPIEDLRKVKFSWMDRFRYDTALARQNPYYDVMVRKMNGSIVQGNLRFATFEEQIDELMSAARKSRTRGVGQRAVPTDEKIFKYIESSAKEELVEEMTEAELRAANFLIERYQEARDYLLKENVLNKYVQDYITHIRRSGLEAYREDGLISAIKESFDQYRLDKASFEVLNNKTGEVLPLEKFFAFAQQRTGGLKPTQNVSRASKAYFMSFERKRALDQVVPELQAYAQSVTPTRKTAKGLDMDPTIKTFLKEYINNKRGRPTTVLFDPGSSPDMAMRSAMATTRLIDLGMSIPNFAAANVGEQVTTFVAQGTKGYARGIRRMNSKRGKEIIEKYRGFVGRSPWQEVRDTSKNWPDKMFTMMLSGFHDASVRANKQGLLAALTKEEFTSGVISPERLARIRLEMGRWRAIDNTASLYGSTGVGKMVTQYKSWAVPILSSTIDNLGKVLRTTSRGENPLKTQAGAELVREAVVVGTVALAINNYFDEDDQSFIGQLINKSARDAMSAVGALSPEMWLQTPRAWQYVQDLEAALRTLVTLEEYKSGEKEGTLKGDDQLLRLVTPAPVRQFGQAAENVIQDEEVSDELDLDLDLGDVDTGFDLDLDLDLDL